MLWLAKQRSDKITECIKKNIFNNNANKYFFNESYNFVLKENNFFYYEDKYGGLKIPKPTMNGQFQLENASTAIATLRILENLKIKDQQITDGIKKANNTARLEEIKSGKLKDLVKNNTLILDSSHNPGGSKALNDYLQTLECKKHVIIGMINHLKGAQIWAKVVSEANGGAHKIYNATVHALICKAMGKKYIVGDTGAGYAGKMLSMAAKKFGLKCKIFMGAKDIKRQQPNVRAMKKNGADVVPVYSGSQTLVDAVSECMRYWVANCDSTHMAVGSTVGPAIFVLTFSRSNISLFFKK